MALLASGMCTRPEKQARYRRYMEYEVCSMTYKACSRDMHME